MVFWVTEPKTRVRGGGLIVTVLCIMIQDRYAVGMVDTTLRCRWSVESRMIDLRITTFYRMLSDRQRRRSTSSELSGIPARIP